MQKATTQRQILTQLTSNGAGANKRSAAGAIAIRPAQRTVAAPSQQRTVLNSSGQDGNAYVTKDASSYNSYTRTIYFEMKTNFCPRANDTTNLNSRKGSTETYS